MRTPLGSAMFACCSGVTLLPSISVKTDWSLICCTSFFTSCLPSLDVNLMALILILPFGCSAVVRRSNACLSAVVRCCLPVLPSAIVSSLSPVDDLGGGAGMVGLF